MPPGELLTFPLPSTCTVTVRVAVVCAPALTTPSTSPTSASIGTTPRLMDSPRLPRGGQLRRDFVHPLDVSWQQGVPGQGPNSSIAVGGHEPDPVTAGSEQEGAGSGRPDADRKADLAGEQPAAQDPDDRSGLLRRAEVESDRPERACLVDRRQPALERERDRGRALAAAAETRRPAQRARAEPQVEGVVARLRDGEGA